MIRRSSKPTSLLILLQLMLSLAIISTATDTTTTTMQIIIKDGDTLVSPTQVFELGFFSPGTTRNRYVGIWFKNMTVQNVVWVANRDTPLRNTTSGVLTVNLQGQLIIESNNSTIWSTNMSRVARNPVVRLLDSANLVNHLPGDTREIYIRMAASELGSNGRKGIILIIVLTSLAGIVLIGLSLALFIWKKNGRKLTKQEGHEESNNDKGLKLHIYDMSTLSKATNSFSNNKKLWEGGFGPVYKGMLDDGKEIVVKRLSKTSSQGVEEFKNEIICIANLQHRNLVKLLECCIEGEEKMLIYEYMHA